MVDWAKSSRDYLNAFDMQVLATGPGLRQTDCEPGVTAVNDAELYARSEIVTLHADLRPENRRMIAATQFASMKPGTVFVNTARGELVDEVALLAALRSGRLTGAALDVLCDERSTGMGDHPLVQYARTHENLLLTPHLGGNTPESAAKTERFLAEKLLAFNANAQ
ncbi:MAG: NAD(P)-dependent oxidoreductase [Pirellulales bacterium]